MIVANPVGKNKAFEMDTNQLEILWKDGHISLPEDDKNNLARELLLIISDRLLDQTPHDPQ